MQMNKSVRAGEYKLISKEKVRLKKVKLHPLNSFKHEARGDVPGQDF